MLLQATPTPASAFIATTGTQGYTLNTSSWKNTWIIYSGATDHMTFYLGKISTHTTTLQSMLSNVNGTILLWLMRVLYLSLTP